MKISTVTIPYSETPEVLYILLKAENIDEAKELIFEFDSNRGTLSYCSDTAATEGFNYKQYLIIQVPTDREIPQIFSRKNYLGKIEWSNMSSHNGTFKDMYYFIILSDDYNNEVLLKKAEKVEERKENTDEKVVRKNKTPITAEENKLHTEAIILLESYITRAKTYRNMSVEMTDRLSRIEHIDSDAMRIRAYKEFIEEYDTGIDCHESIKSTTNTDSKHDITDDWLDERERKQTIEK